MLEELDPYATYQTESLRFTSAAVYLMRAEEAVAASPDTPLGEDHAEFSKVIEDTYGTALKYFFAQLFVARVASFEVFLQESVALVIRKHPKKVGNAEFKLAEILDCPDVSQLVQRAAERHLNDLMYKKPADYLVSICDLLSIDRVPLDSDWKTLIEAKARRDLGMHNAWKCNAIFVRKLTEAGLPVSLGVGDSALAGIDDYVWEVDAALDRLSETITRQMLEKHWPSLVPQFARICEKRPL